MTDTTELLLDAIDKRLLGQELRSLYDDADDSPRTLLLCTHEWNNIGDLAINYDEIAFLERVLPDRRLIPISRSALAANWQRIRRAVRPDDLLAIHGGGNLGDIWPHEEAARLAVVETFGDNRILSMPQSIHFDDPARRAHSMDVYRRHPDLLLAVRDDRSAQIALEHLDADRVVRTEDIVTRHEYPFAHRAHEPRVLFVQRDDKERRHGSGIDGARDRLVASGMRIEVTDTTAPALPFSSAELAAKLVYRKIDEMHAADAVVTDRLHGALFALHARRPVVVFENSYGKIRGALSTLLPPLDGRVVFAAEDGSDVDADLLASLIASPEPAASVPELLAEEHRLFDETVAAFAAR